MKNNLSNNIDLTQSQQLINTYDIIKDDELGYKVKEIIEKLSDTQKNKLLYSLLLSIPVICIGITFICKRK